MEKPRHPPFLARTLAALALLVVLGAGAALAAGIRWSSTQPRVNETHVFEGQINKKGRPVGFHSRPGGHDPRNARLVEVLRRPNRAGVYEARVEIRDPRSGPSGRWLEKRSTLYPDAMSRDEVIRAILNAWRQRTTGGSERFRGPSGRGFTIEGYLLHGDINTAYPIYQ